jgi:hypothetical protein
MKINSSPQSLKSPDQQRRKRLQQLEVIIHGSSWRIGEALLEIRNDRLYRDEYSSFDAYCQERWGHNRAWADRLIKSVELIANFDIKVEEDLDPIGSTFPLNEAQARAFSGLTLDEQIQVMREVTASGKKVTAALITEYAKKYKQPQQQLEEEDGPQDTTDSGEPLALNEQEIDIRESDLRERLRMCAQYIHYQEIRIKQLEQENAHLRFGANFLYGLFNGGIRFISSPSDR